MRKPQKFSNKGVATISKTDIIDHVPTYIDQEIEQSVEHS